MLQIEERTNHNSGTTRVAVRGSFAPEYQPPHHTNLHHDQIKCSVTTSVCPIHSFPSDKAPDRQCTNDPLPKRCRSRLSVARIRSALTRRVGESPPRGKHVESRSKREAERNTVISTVINRSLSDLDFSVRGQLLSLLLKRMSRMKM